MTEPISVRVARLRPCRWGGRPVCPVDECPGWEHEPMRMEHGNMIQVPAEPRDWTQPAAAFALLSEMVDGHQAPEFYGPADDPEDNGYPDGRYACCGLNGLIYGHTLGEAVALAWCAWKEAAR